jgi:predicted nuclease with RNAse H fold
VSVVLGLDIGVKKGCDAVILGASKVARSVGRVHTGEEFRALLDDLAPAAVAIDAPPRWATDGRRQCERELTRRAINLFTTPDETAGTTNSFYAWMQVGFEMFEVAREYAPLETFPHAVAVALNGCLPKDGKRASRVAALNSVGIDTRELRTLDQVDAALCAYTAWCSINGDAIIVGDEAEGHITLPGPSLLDRYTREPS